MSEIKLGTNSTMPVQFTFPDGLSEVDVEKIEFIFKQDKQDGSPILKSALYEPANPDANVDLRDGAFLIHWTRDETYLFSEGQSFFMDTRVWFYGSQDNPPTPIVGLKMDPSLFEKED